MYRRTLLSTGLLLLGLSAPAALAAPASASGSGGATAGSATTILAAPKLLTPKNGDQVTWRANITFDWTDVAGASRYQIDVDGSSSFVPSLIYTSSTFTSSWFMGTPGYYDQTDNTTVGTRYWRVRAFDANGTPGPWSAVSSFVVRK